VSDLLEIKESPGKKELEHAGQKYIAPAIIKLRNLLPHRLKWITRANTITVLRMILIIPIFFGVMYDNSYAFWLFVFASLTDLLDGWIARFDGGGTKLGAFLDATADKVLTLPLIVAFIYLDFLPLWLDAAVAILIALELINQIANTYHYSNSVDMRNGKSISLMNTVKKRKVFSTPPGQLKFWAICLGVCAILLSYIVWPSYLYSIRYFGYTCFVVAIPFAILSLRSKM
jgi:phosphatidylglycerophosphate synthase